MIEPGPAATLDAVTTPRGSLASPRPVRLAFWLTLGALLRRGRNWTRVLLTVLVSIGGFVTLILMVPPYPSYGLLIRLLAPALAGESVAIVALLFARASHEFFTGPR